MPTVITQSHHRGAPIDFDLLEGDLDQNIPGFSKGRTIWWGMAVEAVANAWTEATTLQGLDWVAELHPPNSLQVPLTASNQEEAAWQTIAENCGLLAVKTGATTLNAARDEGRLTVRRFAAVIRRELPALLLDELFWEGGIVGYREGEQGKIRMMVTRRTMETRASRPPEALHEVGQKLLPIAFGSLPVNLGKSLEWLTLARSANVRIEKFSHLWLSVIALVNYSPSNLTQKDRIDAYVSGLSQSLRSSEQATLAQRLKDAYDIRNELWHEANHARVTPELLSSLELDAFTLVDAEFIKIGQPITP